MDGITATIWASQITIPHGRPEHRPPACCPVQPEIAKSWPTLRMMSRSPDLPCVPLREPWGRAGLPRRIRGRGQDADRGRVQVDDDTLAERRGRTTGPGGPVYRSAKGVRASPLAHHIAGGPRHATPWDCRVLTGSQPNRAVTTRPAAASSRTLTPQEAARFPVRRISVRLVLAGRQEAAADRHDNRLGASA
jgi:hypothetical protein